ncbi:RNA polymerase sigma factor [Saccharothrix violaceirubra]|uniref:RNA polymerase sigma-70 factor (ECF subfamily) n=1 Tax=Saccharothrix violaceirubra TaxID=413306 RepID=A0A7W7T4U6_9PSEU|nr:sigma-70 family RNA polymerase sigma factor [Saccharothrix violaceirubra]MBB4966580.1 RNA polymerase sigma-70 factor (ECF subfamily) [Saccharothrix violaceirubra]
MVTFTDFFETTFPGVLSRALMSSGDRHEVEDTVQDAYTEALRAWDRIAHYDSPEAWVARVVRQRLWRSAGRWRYRGPAVPGENAAWVAAQGDRGHARARAVLTALDGLPGRQRVVIVLHCLDGLGQQEIADELGIARGVVVGSIGKGRRTLENALVDPGSRRPLSAGSALPEAVSDPLADVLAATERWWADRVAADSRARERLLRAIVSRSVRG